MSTLMVLLHPAGAVAEQQGHLIVVATLLMLIVILPVMALTVVFAWRYRKSNTRATYTPDWDHSTQLELVIWAVPLLIIIALGAVTWISTHTLDPYRPLRTAAKPITVEVVALDWKWLFIYPEQGIAAVNQLVIPAGTPVEFRLTSATVMNSFFVPQLGSQIYTMGGMTTHLNLLAEKPGEYPGFSANFSGDGFSEMRFVVKSVSAADFNRWLEQARASGSALDDAGYAELAKPSRAVPPTTYRSVEPKLFERIIDQTLAGPQRVGGATCCPPLRQAGG